MKTLLSCLIALLLTACATETQLVSSAPSVTVQVPVLVPCVDAADVPAVPALAPLPPAGLTPRIAALLADLKLFESYAAKADVMLRACTK